MTDILIPLTFAPDISNRAYLFLSAQEAIIQMKYHIGQYIMYRSKGVCKIEAIGKIHFSPDTGKEYYTLRPPFTTSDERIYVPVNAEDAIKNIMTTEEAFSYLQTLKKLQIRPSRSTKMPLLTTHYQELLSASDVSKHLQLFKELYKKETIAAEKGKKLGEIDRQFKKKVEHLLGEEFAIVLNESPETSVKRLYTALA